MILKNFLISLIIFNYSTCYGMLRRTPKVYNALITTDDNLTPSRAFPVIQPTIHETGIAHLPFGPYNPYQFYSPPLLQQADYQLQQAYNPLLNQGFPSQFIPQGQAPVPFPPQHGSEKPLPIDYSIPDKQLEPPRRQQDQKQNSNDPNQPSNNKVNSMKQDQMQVMPLNYNRPIQQQPQQQLPIPLNEFGLPPGLIPLQSLPPQRPDYPVNLQPYPYNNYPLVFDGPFPQLPQQQQPIPSEHLLPHYGYVPQYPFGIRHQQRPYKKRRPSGSSSTTTKRPSNGNAKELDLDAQQPQQFDGLEDNTPPQLLTSLGSIVNGNENKNSEVPDVPPPPIPSGAKNSEENDA